MSSALGIGKGRPSTLPPRKSYHPREASGGVFNLFSPAQIKQFKECFTMIDTDGDGKIGVNDLKETLGNLGQIPSDRLLSSLLSSPNSTSGRSHHDDSINFTQFLTLFGERLIELDSEEDLVEAFSSFEGGGTAGAGKVDVQEMRGWLAEYGDKMSDEEIDRLFRGPFTDRQGKTFDYVEFAKSLKVNANGEMKEDALGAE